MSDVGLEHGTKHEETPEMSAPCLLHAGQGRSRQPITIRVSGQPPRGISGLVPTAWWPPAALPRERAPRPPWPAPGQGRPGPSGRTTWRPAGWATGSRGPVARLMADSTEAARSARRARVATARVRGPNPGLPKPRPGRGRPGSRPPAKGPPAKGLSRGACGRPGHTRGLLDGFDRVLAAVCTTGRRLTREELESRRAVGERAAEAGFGLRVLVRLYSMGPCGRPGAGPVPCRKR